MLAYIYIYIIYFLHLLSLKSKLHIYFPKPLPDGVQSVTQVIVLGVSMHFHSLRWTNVMWIII